MLILKVIYLWIKYAYYGTTFKRPLLITRDKCYEVSPEAVHWFRITTTGAYFIGTVDGTHTVDFFIPISSIITLKEIK